MHIRFLWIGKSKYKEYNPIIEEYVKRIRHYTRCTITELKTPASLSRNPAVAQKKEAELIISKFDKADMVVLLDEKGHKMNSMQFSKWIQHKMNTSVSSLVFVIAGAHGAHYFLKERSDHVISLSDFTFTHDMARMIIAEQVYRAFTIIRGEKYHNG